MEIFNNKSSPIAWFVSNCHTVSRRNNLVRKINTTMNVDIYGKCGKLKCPVDSPKCYDLLESKYFFYLSFENALCNDYVTEKLFRPMGRHVIPIVFNGGKTSFFAPLKSFIDANSFKEVDDLLTYLKYLIDNPREYLKFFWWKKYYKVLQHPTYKFMLCDVCKKLNDPNFMSTKHQYDDIFSWWSNKQCHTKSHIKF